MIQTNFKRANRLKQALFYRPADTHNLAGGFHLRGKRVVRLCKLVKWETRHFAYHIVQGWFKGRRRICNLNFIQRHSNPDFGRHTSNGIPAGLGSQGGRTGYSGVDLDKIILERIRIKGKLYIASAFNF